MPWDTLAEIEADVWRRAGLGTVSTTGDFYTLIREQIERAYHEICNGGPEGHSFLWLRAAPPGVLRTTDDITTGTISVTQGQQAATLSSAPSADVVNREIIITGWNEVYRISVHGSGTAITLDSAFNGTTNATASYVIFQREYALDSDVKEILEMHVPDGNFVIVQKDEAWLLDYLGDALPRAVWPPQYFARIGQQRIRFDGYPNVSRRVEYAHTVIPADIVDGGTILVPRNFRQVIADGALYWTHLARNDDRADAAGILYGAGIQNMIAADQKNRTTLGRATGKRRSFV